MRIGLLLATLQLTSDHVPLAADSLPMHGAPCSQASSICRMCACILSGFLLVPSWTPFGALSSPCIQELYSQCLVAWYMVDN